FPDNNAPVRTQLRRVCRHARTFKIPGRGAKDPTIKGDGSRRQARVPLFAKANRYIKTILDQIDRTIAQLHLYFDFWVVALELRHQGNDITSPKAQGGMHTQQAARSG